MKARIELTQEIRKEIISSIAKIQSWIDKENAISADFRYNDKIANYRATIQKQMNYLNQGYINL